jgi:hypothetical protein
MKKRLFKIAKTFSCSFIYLQQTKLPLSMHKHSYYTTSVCYNLVHFSFLVFPCLLTYFNPPSIVAIVNPKRSICNSTNQQIFFFSTNHTARYSGLLTCNIPAPKRFKDFWDFINMNRRCFPILLLVLASQFVE